MSAPPRPTNAAQRARYRGSLLKAIQQGNPEVHNTLFWKVWPVYTKFVCPIAIGAVFLHSVLS